MRRQALPALFLMLFTEAWCGADPEIVKRLNSLQTTDDTYDKSDYYQNLQEAEKARLVFTHQQEFSMKINSLTLGNSRVPCCIRILNLDPFLDEGLIRVGGR